MIYSKTNLKKIPTTCSKCKFSILNRYFDMRRCTLLNNKECKKIKSKSGNLMYTKLKECPLVNTTTNNVIS